MMIMSPGCRPHKLKRTDLIKVTFSRYSMFYGLCEGGTRTKSWIGIAGSGCWSNTVWEGVAEYAVLDPELETRRGWVIEQPNPPKNMKILLCK